MDFQNLIGNRDRPLVAMKDHGGSKVNTNRRLKGMVYGMWNGELLEDQHHRFRAGDLVWAKMKNLPWWPGQVYDPRDASDLSQSLRYSREGLVLVCFFGGGASSSSWFLPQDLVPFVENLEKMWSEMSWSTCEKAVHVAFDEIGRLMESRILCRCLSLEKRGHLVAKNASVKGKLLVPEVDIDRLPIPQYEPADIRAKLLGFPRTASLDSVLHVTVLRSWISAYSYAECGGMRLAKYSELILIQGLEDEEKVIPKDATVSQRKRQRTAAELASGGGFMDDPLVVLQSNEIESKAEPSTTRESKKAKFLLVLNLTFITADNLVLDARVIRKMVDSMNKMLESCGSKFSSDEEPVSREEMKCLMEKVVTVSDKVRLMDEKSSS